MTEFRVLFTDRKHPDLDIEREVLKRIDATVIDATDEGPDFLERELRMADAVCNQYTVLDRARVEQMEQARVISHYGIGVNRIDVDAATERNIWVANAPDYCTEEVAMHSLALILNLERGIVEYDRLYRGGTWTYDLGRPLHRISGRTLGLLGLGRIARRLAQYAAALGYRVCAYDPILSDEDFAATGVERSASVIDLVASADVISVHTPLTDATRNMINAEVLAHAKPGLRVVNAGRGAVIDEVALREALEQGRAVAGLDVIASEPPSMADPIFAAPGTTLTPHAAFYSEEAYEELRRTVAENIVSVFETGRPLHFVNTVSAARGIHV
ncbi:C-terminal binding protein [Embleya sp. NPDC056575]|uniref:C-terminal binding protein n=1 Tax=unclassified Embleya TaxID=2699296 RepID=UPI0036A0E3D6